MKLGEAFGVRRLVGALVWVKKRRQVGALQNGRLSISLLTSCHCPFRADASSNL